MRASAGQLAAQYRAGWDNVTRHHPFAVSMLGLWLIAVLGDAATTYFMMRHHGYIEGNQYASAAMNQFGLGGWVLTSVLCCLLLALPSLAKPAGGPVAMALFAGSASVGLLKLLTTAENVAQWLHWDWYPLVPWPWLY